MKICFKSFIIPLVVGVICNALGSCNAAKKVPYTVQAEMIPIETLSQLNTVTDPVLRPGDLLNIDVVATDLTAVVPFNKDLYVSPDGTIQRFSTSSVNNTTGNNNSTRYYLVNAEGEIDFPGIGIMKVAGLTKEELADEIVRYIYPKFIKERPTVDVRLMNFQVIVMGAVGHSGAVTSRSERLNLLEAIAMAGDLNIRGDRENILLYRTNPDGTREVHKLNINDRNILMSPYFNLQQNDIIYVVPNKAMQRTAWQMNPYITAVFTYVGGLSSIIALVVSIINLANK